MVHTVGADEARVQPEANASHERAGSQSGEIEEVKGTDEPKGTQEKLLDLLTGLTERMERLEASQERQEEKERLKGHEPSVFGSSLGPGRPMDRQALEQTPPPRNSPGVSPATYFSLRQHEYANTAANVEMAQAPQALPQHFIPPQTYHPQPAGPTTTRTELRASA
ncbi:hypothetical protein PC129_g5704 [Phytophthora cactorum]|uniref:Uncharacterized protein n=1 Tax=Phytophthora cactorum TaxID=29920 RepID=A0A8T0YJF3_9STRA|nr:hypothetical protein Pcac1_g26612 [Phytophthora cactorum]KAG2813946.1 hypothetical protein PC112_g14521 [Phytophthora cactorum]KAG2815718.1 hypothetical protein PC111_g13449 [Phytophthora cactorum]KAG2852834.1 hypothetical protein PC113_g14695 [Phytophthora cactorum]KAG2913910.1 hypothetical protein PC114_g8398 [Phytophthora cactorum]